MHLCFGSRKVSRENSPETWFQSSSQLKCFSSTSEAITIISFHMEILLANQLLPNLGFNQDLVFKWYFLAVFFSGTFPGFLIEPGWK